MRSGSSSSAWFWEKNEVATLWPKVWVPASGSSWRGDEAAEGGFARAVRADDGEFLALVDFEIEAAEDVERAVGFRDRFEFRDRVAGVRRRREFEIHHRVVALGLRDALDFREHLDARLDERRLVSRGAEAVDEALDFRRSRAAGLRIA